MSAIIEVDGVGKKLCRSLKRGIFYGLSDSLRMGLGFSLPSSTKLRKEEFWALKDISFSVNPGETIGLVGSNGSGKTTLLRLINGIYPLTEGKITIRGQVAPLIGVGAAFHPHLSGRENIAINAALLGMSRQELRKVLDAIVEFAEIRHSLGAPLASYSSGMKIRLGFAIAVHCNIDIILADEILAVGDAAFQAKCLKKISDLRKQGVSTLLVSHDTEVILAHSSRVVLLDKGSFQFSGDPSEGIAKYRALRPGEALVKDGREIVTGISGISVSEVIMDPKKSDGLAFVSEEGSLRIKLCLLNQGEERAVVFRVSVRAPLVCAEPIFTNDSDLCSYPLQRGSSELECKLTGLNIKNIELSVDVQIRCKKTDEMLYWISRLPVQTQRSKSLTGFLNYETKVELKQTERV